MTKKAREPERAKEYNADDLDDLKRAILASDAGDDRTTAIMNAALIDETLERTLRFFLTGGIVTQRSRPSDAGDSVKPNRKVIDALFGPKGPLTDFSSKIDLCFAMGIIGEITYHNLKLIKDIRNKFAHEWLMKNKDGELLGLSFESRRIKGWCGSLKWWKGQFASDMEDQEDSEPVSETAAEKFKLICLAIVLTLFYHPRRNTEPKPFDSIIP